MDYGLLANLIRTERATVPALRTVVIQQSWTDHLAFEDEPDLWRLIDDSGIKEVCEDAGIEI